MTHTKIPLLDLTPQNGPIKLEIMQAIERVVDSQSFILGPAVDHFERLAEQYLQVPHAVGVSSGTDALLVSLMALGVGPGDEVVTSPYSFFATAGVVARLGATPVFVDIDPATFNINPALLAAALTARTKAVMPVHLFGLCADMDKIRAVTQGRVPIVEDAAQAFGARDAHNRPAGSLGNLGCFSFFPSKNLGAMGDGGLVTAIDPALAERVRVLRVHGSKPKYHHELVGGNFRLDAMQAAILSVKLKYLNTWTDERRRNADRYRRLMESEGLSGRIGLPLHTPTHVYNQFVIRLPRRDAMRECLASRGIATEVYYPIPLHLQPCFRGLNHRPGDFPHSEAAARDSLALPIGGPLTEADQRRIVRALAECVGPAEVS